MNTDKDNQNNLESIFKFAERRMTEFNIPLTNEGKYEVLMYGIWLGMKALDEFGIPQNQEESLARVNDFLIEYANRLGIPPERKAERLFVLRDGDWYRETKSFAESNYPQTKQYLPDYHYLCFVDSPLVFYSPMALCDKVKQIASSDLIDFLAVFGTYYNKLIDDFKVFESESASYKSQVSQIIEQDSQDEDNQDYKSVYKDFEKEIIERVNAQDIGALPLEKMLFIPSYTLGLLDKVAVETIRSFNVLNMGKATDAMSEFLKKDLDYLQKNRDGVVEYAIPMLEKDIETRKRCAVLLRSMDEEKYTDSKEELESVISRGEETLRSFRQLIDSTLNLLDYVISVKSGKFVEDFKSGKYKMEGATDGIKGKSKSGCMSLFVGAFIIAIAIIYLF